MKTGYIILLSYLVIWLILSFVVIWIEKRDLKREIGKNKLNLSYLIIVGPILQIIWPISFYVYLKTRKMWIDIDKMIEKESRI